MNVPRHDADLDLIRRDNTRTVRTEQQCASSLHPVARANHVTHRNALGNADDEIQIGIHRLVDRGRGERRRHVNHAHIRAGRVFRFLYGRVDRNALEVLAGLLGQVALEDLHGTQLHQHLVEVARPLFALLGEHTQQ